MNTLQFSDKEREILHHLCKGVPGKTIPSLVYLTKASYCRMVERLKRVTGCQNDNQLCYRAGTEGWVSTQMN